MQPKRGYTLIEMMATMSLTSAVLALLAIWLTTALRHQGAAAEHLLQTNTRDRLARQFRQDVHAARAVLPAEAMPQADVRLKLDLGDQRIVQYVANGRHLERIEQIEEKVVHREQYAVEPAMVSIEHATDEQPEQVVLVIKKTVMSRDEKTSVALRVEALRGSDRRFEGGSKNAR